MIVVVIIGILAAVAIPSYQSFQQKSRDTEAKMTLSGIYTAEVTYFAEFDSYSGNLNTIGLQPFPLKHYGCIGFGLNLLGGQFYQKNSAIFISSSQSNQTNHPSSCQSYNGRFRACADTGSNCMWAGQQQRGFSINEKRELIQL